MTSNHKTDNFSRMLSVSQGLQGVRKSEPFAYLWQGSTPVPRLSDGRGSTVSCADEKVKASQRFVWRHDTDFKITTLLTVVLLTNQCLGNSSQLDNVSSNLNVRRMHSKLWSGSVTKNRSIVSCRTCDTLYCISCFIPRRLPIVYGILETGRVKLKHQPPWKKKLVISIPFNLNRYNEMTEVHTVLDLFTSSTKWSYFYNKKNNMLMLYFKYIFEQIRISVINLWCRDIVVLLIIIWRHRPTVYIQHEENVILLIRWNKSSGITSFIDMLHSVFELIQFFVL